MKKHITTQFTKPTTKRDREVTFHSYGALNEKLKHLKTDTPEIEFEKTGEPIKVPCSALDLLGEILKVLSEGRPVSVFPVPTEMTTQAAADHLNVSRPYLVKLLEREGCPSPKSADIAGSKLRI